jgi:hypothetical protein
MIEQNSKSKTKRLPRIYESKENPKFEQYLGKPKLSYSQYTSWKDPKYKEDYIRTYFLNGERTTNAFAQFGSACGGYLEDKTIDTEWLSARDIEVLDKVDRPEDAQYEVEIVIDRNWYVIQGYIDQMYPFSKNGVVIKDFKTGDYGKKKDFYADINQYGQTNVYAYGINVYDKKEIDYCGVTLLDRKGNPFRGENLKLTGGIYMIPTPYSLEEATRILEEIDLVAEEISEYWELYLESLTL